MRLIAVDSSNVAAIGYDAAARELQVQFKSGGTYSHFNVPPEAHSALMAAESHGKHYNESIKGTYPSRPTADVVRPRSDPDVFISAPTNEEAKINMPEPPLTLDALIARLGLPADTVLRGTVESMMARMTAEQILEIYGRYGIR